MVRQEVCAAAWRWRWRRLERQFPSIVQGKGGHGMHVRPILKLLDGRCACKEWNRSHQGGLRSAFLGKQWIQSRLFSAKLAETSVCQLCVNLGYCDAEDPDPRFKGTEVHRLWECQPLDELRRRIVPAHVLQMARAAIKADGTMSPLDRLLFTRAIMPSLAPMVAQPPEVDRRVEAQPATSVSTCTAKCSGIF